METKVGTKIIVLSLINFIGLPFIEESSFYSARLYKVVTGLKVAAVFCMCLDHPHYTKVCTEIIV